MLDEFNKHMGRVFSPSWVSCLDESMSPWIQRWSCPGWQCVPRKPKPFGNEYHTICCGLSGVLYQLDMVEGKSRNVRAMGPKEFETLGETVGLLMRMTRPIWNTGKTVVMDSGFCVLEGLRQLQMKGVYGHALIKKKKTWPKHIPGAMIDHHFETKDIGDVDSLKGLIGTTPFHVFCLKEPDFICKIMATHTSENRVDDHNTRRSWVDPVTKETRSKEFKYTEVFSLHYRYRHQIDDHNNRRHNPIGIEETWATKRWPIRVFSFIIAVTEVNAYRMKEYLRENYNAPQLHFRRALACLCLENNLDAADGPQAASTRARRVSQQEHRMENFPPFCGKWNGNRWTRVSTKYCQQRCECKKRVRTYCICDKVKPICNICFVEHLNSVNY